MADSPDTPRIAEVVAGALGLGDATTPREEMFWALKRFLLQFAGRRPLVCVLEDIHWAEPTLLDLLEHVIGQPRHNAPLLIACTARPEILDQRPAWATPRGPARSIALGPLGTPAIRRLSAHLVGADGTDVGLVERVVRAAEGNPLFAEEIVHALKQQPASPGSAIDAPMPMSLLAVIAARIDGLPEDERAVAQRVSVIGRSFATDAALALMDDPFRAATRTHLRSLVRRDVLMTERPAVLNGDGYSFRHVLIRDAAYDALAKADRADLHERLARWTEASVDDRPDNSEIVGYHYEQAVLYRRELGRVDQQTAELALVAGERLSAAGWRAYQRGDPEAAIKLLRRAVALLPAGSGRRSALVALGLASIVANRFDIAESAIDELEAEAGSAEDELSAWKARLLRQSIRMWAGGAAERDATASAAMVDDAIAAFARAGDHHGLAIAYAARVDEAIEQSRADVWWAASERVIHHAELVGDHALGEKHRGWLVATALWGQTPVREVLRLADAELARNRSRPAVAELLQHRALAYAMNAEPEHARADVEQSRRIRTELFGPERAAVYTAGIVEELIGDLPAAEASYRATSAVLEAMGETGGRSTILGYLGVMLFDLGRPDGEVGTLGDECRSLATDGDVLAQAQWRQVLALVSARSGDSDRGEELIAEAESLMARTDDLRFRGLIARDHGRVRQYARDNRAARSNFGRALRFFEEKGDVVDTARIKRLLATA